MIHWDIKFCLTVLKYLSVWNFGKERINIVKITLVKIVLGFL